MTSASTIFSAGLASQYPPSAPRWLCTRPACFSSSRMFSRKLSGICCASAIRSPLTGPSPATASSTAAHPAYTTTAETRIAGTLEPRREVQREQVCLRNDALADALADAPVELAPQVVG